MSLAEPKAMLVSAYQSGERPVFDSVLPGGRDEVWKLANLAVVMPAIPADAPPQLEFALRVRRETMTAGTCPQCGAVPDFESAVDFGDIPTLAAMFKHRVTCPGNDSSAKKMLDAYWEGRASKGLEQRVDEVTVQTRERVAALREHGTEMSTQDGQLLAKSILDGLLPGVGKGTVCAHIAEDPVRIWNCLIAVGAWKCDECWAYFGQEIQEGFTLGDLEERTCDLCHRYAPRTMQPLMLRIDHFVMAGGACARCRARYAPSEMDGESA